MAQILVVDDSPIDRRLVGTLLERHALNTGEPDWNIVYAVDGKKALEVIGRQPLDLVLTDLQMPELDGLELVEILKGKFPALPVILMTGHGSEDTAFQALQRGAASYVSKKNLARDLLATVEDILNMAGTQQYEQKLLEECWVQTESWFRLPNDLAHISPLVTLLQANLTRMRICDENGLLRVAVALREALSNAIIHGNLEVSSELRDREDQVYHTLIEQRRNEEPFEDRWVHVQARESHAEAMYVIRDEGPGFDPTGLPDPTDPANLEKPSGRGLLLIRTFMDEVRFNREGNEITMIKRGDRGT